MDPEDLRAAIPALDSTTYLNTGAGSPSPEPVVEATTECVEHQQYVAPTTEGMYSAVFDAFEESRETIAGFLGTTPDEIALTQSTADGIARIAAALPFEAGDTVVRTDCEHSAGILPWKRLRDTAGISVRVLETEQGRLDLDDLKRAVSDARLVCLSSITWNYGTRFPIEEIVEIAHDAGVLVLVDAVQSPGQVPVDLDSWGAEFVVGAGHKWLLGPWGAGFVYVRDGAETHLDPRMVGYRSVTDANAENYELAPGARRLEVGTASPAPHVGLSAALDLLEDVGIETVAAHDRRLAERLVDGIETERLLSPSDPESGLVTIADDDPETTVERLADHDIRIRSLPYPEAIRVSLHVFNTAEDVDTLLEHL